MTTTLTKPEVGSRVKISGRRSATVVDIEPTFTEGIDRYWVDTGNDIIAVYLDELH